MPLQNREIVMRPEVQPHKKFPSLFIRHSISVIFFMIPFSPFCCIAQAVDVKRIDPPFWFTLMNERRLQLCVYGNGIAKYNVNLDYAGVVLEKINKVENQNYLFLDLTVALETKPGVILLKFTSSGKSFTYPYELRSRIISRNRASGISSADLIYLITPDRFANGDTANDAIAAMNQKSVNRNIPAERHGGDISGIIKNLPYLKFLGVSTLQLNPVLADNQPSGSYNGYAVTDHYKIDPRFATNELYSQFVETCHNAKMKVVFDVVLNAIGSEHWFYKDLPSKDWVHSRTDNAGTANAAGALIDPYASEIDKKIIADGWMDKNMPDLNQKNPFVASYLIQNSIWWIELTGLDAFCVDNYACSDLDFENNWTKAVHYEYPRFSIFGESRIHGVTNQSFFTKSKYTHIPFYSELPGVADFQLYYALNDALNRDSNSNDGMTMLYETLCSDFVYDDPARNVIFVDNCELNRYYSQCGEDMNKWKMGIVFLFTARGIPMIYYGTEILMKNINSTIAPHDFPGGWNTDTINKFKPPGRTETENEAHAFISRLANWRQFREAITKGKLMQFVPVDGVYVYFRYTANQAIMVIMNNNKNDAALDTGRFAERMLNYKTAWEVTTGKNISEIKNIIVPAKTAWILELK